MKKLTIGLLLESVHANKYVYELVLWAKSQPNLCVSHLILYPRPACSTLGRLGYLIRNHQLIRLISNAALRVITVFEKLLIRFSHPHRDHFSVVDLSKIVNEVVNVRPIVSCSGHVHRFSEDDVKTIGALNLDLLIQCSSGILRGGILRASRLGIIAVRHGDDRLNRGGPAGFWESYYRWPKTGFVIRCLTEEADAGDALLRGWFATRYFYSLNQAHVYKKSMLHLMRLLEKAGLTGSLPPADPAPAPYSNQIFGSPRLPHCVIYAGKLLWRVSARAAAKSLARRQRFGISVLLGRWNKAVFWRSTEVPLPRGRFWADPFLWTSEGKTFCFVEDFAYKKGVGHITVLEIDGTRATERGVALQEPFHLSFPFLFEYQGQLYMCPESANARQVRVYRCVQFPLKWRLEKVLLDGVSAVDTMLFHRGNRWWMLTNIDESGTRDFESELYLFSAESPLSTVWTPHPYNPIRIDSFGGRNAGLIIDEDRIYRVGQCQGFDQYGQALQIYEIRELSESHYHESVVAEITPNFRKGLLGLHHLSTDGKITVVDPVAYSFVIS
jgi:hypothetical protein